MDGAPCHYIMTEERDNFWTEHYHSDELGEAEVRVNSLPDDRIARVITADGFVYAN